MDIETITFITAFLIQFGGVVWWASRVTAVQAALTKELRDIADALEQHIKASNETNLELYRLIERLSAAAEAPVVGLHRPRVAKGS